MKTHFILLGVATFTILVTVPLLWFVLNQKKLDESSFEVTVFAYEKDGSHIFDGAMIAAIDVSNGKIVAEQVADHDGRVVFQIIPGLYRFQPSPLRENRVVGIAELKITGNYQGNLLLTEVGPGDFGAPVDTCEEKYDAVEGIFETANYCQTDADCAAIPLGGEYVDFGCWKYVYKGYNTSILYQRMDQYVSSCAKAINKCSPSPSAVCRVGRCVEAE
ncbi:MAG: hypothetical protein AAB524_01250 [Patescibacteria group bacterium]